MQSGPGGRREEELLARCKGQRAKVLRARRLRQETTLSLKWIAQRLHMGSWTCVSPERSSEPPWAQSVPPFS